MSGPAFFQTRMGMRYYEHTMPELVRQVTRLNDLIERFVGQVELDREQVGTSAARSPTPTAIKEDA
jgi:hypothetical protein